MENLKLKGKWWIPSNAPKQISGVFTSEQYIDSILALEDYFWDAPSAKISEPAIILGQSEDKTNITLYNVNTRTDFPISSSFSIGFVFIGEHFHDRDEIKFESIGIRYSEIDNWIPMHIYDRYSSEKHKSQNKSKTISADTNRGFTIDLVAEDEPMARPRIFVNIKSSDKDHMRFDDYFKMKNYVQDFLSFALARPIQTLSMEGLMASTIGINENDSDENDSRPIKIYHAEFLDPFILRRKYHRQLFFFGQIADNFEICLRRWIENENRLREVIALYISVIDSPSIYLQIQFQMVMYALEVYHRITTIISQNECRNYNRKIAKIYEFCPTEYKEWLFEELKYSYEPNLASRLRELILRYEQIFHQFTTGKSEFVSKAVKTRNYFTHYGTAAKAGAVFNNNQLRSMIDKLIGLLEVNLLMEIATIFQIKKMYHTLDKIIANVMQSLPQLYLYPGPDGRQFVEDPNPKDVYHLADAFRDFYKFSLNIRETENINAEDVVGIVEIVEDDLLRPSAIKPVYRDPNVSDPRAIRIKGDEQIIDELLKVAERVLKKHPNLGKPEEVLMKGLFMWYGCISIDKACRHKDIHNITPHNRMKIHGYLVKQSKLNPWIKKGFISARFFRQTEDQLKLKDFAWIPHDSIYWGERVSP